MDNAYPLNEREADALENPAVLYQARSIAGLSRIATAAGLDGEATARGIEAIRAMGEKKARRASKALARSAQLIELMTSPQGDVVGPMNDEAPVIETTPYIVIDTVAEITEHDTLVEETVTSAEPVREPKKPAGVRNRAIRFVASVFGEETIRDLPGMLEDPDAVIDVLLSVSMKRPKDEMVLRQRLTGLLRGEDDATIAAGSGASRGAISMAFSTFRKSIAVNPAYNQQAAFAALRNRLNPDADIHEVTVATDRPVPDEPTLEAASAADPELLFEQLGHDGLPRAEWLATGRAYFDVVIPNAEFPYRARAVWELTHFTDSFESERSERVAAIEALRESYVHHGKEVLGDDRTADVGVRSLLINSQKQYNGVEAAYANLVRRDPDMTRERAERIVTIATAKLIHEHDTPRTA